MNIQFTILAAETFASKAEKAERNLSDDAFDRLRKKLLECWEQV